MKLLMKIFHDEGLNLEGPVLKRDAVKGIIREGCKLLMIYGANGGGYKFPGGGVAEGETDEQALAREIREECGRRLLRVEGEFGQVVEYKRPFEAEYAVFKMISRYYVCQVDNEMGELRLDAYEQELGFHPVWVELGDAIQVNRVLLSSGGAEAPDWIRREAYVIEQVKLQILR
jgi:8-oxo-dGTP pyrophosphatase MutT (NUDIX family)